MAHIVGEQVVKSAGTDLAKADLERQADIFRLARMGDPRSDLMWRRFAQSDRRRASFCST